jgi:hypothetical protein
MLLERSTDAAHLNRIANDPSVRPYLGLGVGDVDLAPVLQNPSVYALTNEHGGLVFLPVLSGLYSVHTLFLPSGRGAKAVRAALEAVDWLFSNTDAKAVTTEVPATNAPAGWLARRCGFQKTGRREDAWMTPGGDLCAIDDYVLTRPLWTERNSRGRVM